MARKILYSPQGQDAIEVPLARVEFLKSKGWTEEGISREKAPKSVIKKQNKKGE